MIHMRNNEILLLATTCMDLKSDQERQVLCHLYVESKTVELLETETGMVLSRGLGGGGGIGGVLVKGFKLSLTRWIRFGDLCTAF